MGGCQVTHDDIDIRHGLAQGFHGVHYATAVAMGGIYGQYVHFAFHQLPGALDEITRCSDRRADKQTPLRILRRRRILQFLLDIFDRNQALEDVVAIDDQELLDTMFVQNAFRFFKGCADRDGDQVFLGP